MRLLLLYLFLLNSLFSLNFKVASYNVENLFDLQKNGKEYKEYLPFTKYNWNEKNYNIKLKNIAEVLSDLNADIVALQEIENEQALKDLLKTLKKEEELEYKYYSITSSKTTIQNAIISKFKIINSKEIFVKKGYRNILKSIIDIDGVKLTIFANHWKSKWGKESKRILYAKALKKKIDNIRDKDFIILGDLNSNFNEYLTFKHNKKLNNTNGKTGINHILKTIKNKKLVNENLIKSSNKYLYNLWLEIYPNDRYSRKFYKSNGTPDAFLLPHTLFDNKGINYIDNSFKVFKAKYLFSKPNVVKRWQRNKKKYHTGTGYSDHLPIYATFTTNKFKDKEEYKTPTLTIKQILDTKQIDKNFILKNITISKKKYGVIITDNSKKKIFIYKPKHKFQYNKQYTILVGTTVYYKQKEEIKGYDIWLK